MDNNPILIVKDIKKSFDHTIAVNNLSLQLERGEVLSLIGANGAGKSTLTNILSGVITPNCGNIEFNKVNIDINKYNPHEAKKLGIRVVHQELSLCKNLTVYENFFIENGNNPEMNLLKWRKNAKKMASSALEKIFPDNTININSRLDSLSIAQMQMVEIARVFIDKEAKLIILDEPTSSLPNKETQQLLSYIKNSLNSGISYIYISHRLKEVQDISNHIFIMQNGERIHFSKAEDISIKEMVNKMSTLIQKNDKTCSPELVQLNTNVEVKMNGYSKKGLKNIDLNLYGGEIIGVSGLEGNGQQELLQAIFFGKNSSEIYKSGKVAYVAGDRSKEGILPLWSIKDNSAITCIADKPLLKQFPHKDVNECVGNWNARLKTKCVNWEDNILSLSGGNQQKVLLTRALVADADIIILDDPSKGVDVETKQEFYQIFDEIAKSGKLIIWHSSDDTELEYCSKILVLSEGEIVGTFLKEEFNHSKLMHTTFGSLAKDKKENQNNIVKNKKSLSFLPAVFAALALYIISGILSPSVFSSFGIELLAVGFTPFILGALAQTYIIGLGHIDLGIGPFMGLVNVICATILYKNTSLGILILLLLLIAYGCMGLLIYWRKIPSIIVTLSMSFFWIGLAYVIQDVPGGTTPLWMISLFNFSNFIIPGILVWLLGLIGVSILIYRTRLGTVLKGFGNNERSMINSGWSSYKAYFSIYFIAGSFALLAGISQSAITCASDVNAMSTYTILTVAAVIIGGGFFSGGYVSHIGTIFGGIVLTMVSVILGLFRVSTDFTATIQGFVLILILSLRLINKETKSE